MLQTANPWLQDWELLDNTDTYDRLSLGALNLYPNEKDEALVLLYILYFLVVGIPVFFKDDGETIRTFRQNLAYYLLKGNLPV